MGVVDLKMLNWKLLMVHKALISDEITREVNIERLEQRTELWVTAQFTEYRLFCARLIVPSL